MGRDRARQLRPPCRGLDDAMRLGRIEMPARGAARDPPPGARARPAWSHIDLGVRGRGPYWQRAMRPPGPRTPCGSRSARPSSYCKPVAEARLISGDKRAYKPSWETGVCWGFFSAVQVATRLQFHGDPAPALYICAPPESTLVQMVLIFRRYVEVNPSVAHEKAFFVAFEALKEAFPCKD